MEEIILEDVNSEDYLSEMANIPSAGNFKNNFTILLGVSPDKNRIGNPYFKVYNSTSYNKATKVCRISFLKPELITGHREQNGKKEWLLQDFNSSIRSELIEYLNSYSGRNNNITVWTDLKYSHNFVKELGTDVSEYISGVYDTPENLANPNYLPYSLQIPDYMNLRYNKRGR